MKWLKPSIELLVGLIVIPLIFSLVSTYLTVYFNNVNLIIWLPSILSLILVFVFFNRRRWLSYGLILNIISDLIDIVPTFL